MVGPPGMTEQTTFTVKEAISDEFWAESNVEGIILTWYRVKWLYRIHSHIWR